MIRIILVLYVLL